MGCGMWKTRESRDVSKVLAELMEGGHGRRDTGRLWVGWCFEGRSELGSDRLSGASRCSSRDIE